jgi:hypothetical protein
MDPSLIVFVAIGIAVATYWGYRSRIERQEKAGKYARAAAENGWAYSGRDDSLADRFDGPPFGQGHSRVADHVFTGEHRGRPFTAFEYRYETGGGDSGSRSYVFMVGVVPLPGPTPRLQVAPETWRTKALGYVGMRDLQLESEEFNELFRVDTDDERFAYAILHPRMMRWLIDSPRTEYTSVRFERGHLLAWHESAIEAADVAWLLGHLCDILERVPDDVWT